MYALVLTNWNLANSSTSQEQSNKERLMRCIIYVLNVFNRFFGCCQEGILYIYTGVGLSALLVSTCRAMREPQFVKRVTELAPRFFICIDYEDKFRQQRESVGCVCERN